MLKYNVLANFFGKGWSLLIGLIFVPFYISFLGIEAYGLIGFFSTIQATVSLLDFGLSATMNREMARFSVHPDRSDESRDLARTLEIVYWCVGIIIGIGIYFAASWLSTNWVNAKNVSIQVVQQSIVLMGITISLQWPIGLYSGGLSGLERQVSLNMFTASLGTFRSVGAILVLWIISPTLTAFFYWQIFVSILQVIFITIMFWKYMPQGTRLVRFDVRLLRRVWRFTAGMSATAFVTFLISQIDKVILSKILPLNMFGYYTLANQINIATRMSGSSIFNAFLPRFSALVAKGDEKALRTLYHQGCQLVSAVVLPVSAIIALFSYKLIFMWTQNETIALMTYPIASILVMGSVFNSLMGIPYDMTVAHGWVKLGFYQNLLSAIVLVPAIFFLATHFGGIGAAWAWVTLNFGCMLISAPIIHNRILKGELRQWYLVDIGFPLLVSFAVSGLCWWFMPRNLRAWPELFIIGAALTLTLTACVVSLPYIRQRVLGFINLQKRLEYVFGNKQ